MLDSAFANVEEKVVKEGLEKDFKLEFISPSTLKTAFPFFGKLPALKKRIHKEFDKVRALALN